MTTSCVQRQLHVTGRSWCNRSSDSSQQWRSVFWQGKKENGHFLEECEEGTVCEGVRSSLVHGHRALFQGFIADVLRGRLDAPKQATMTHPVGLFVLIQPCPGDPQPCCLSCSKGARQSLKAGVTWITGVM